MRRQAKREAALDPSPFEQLVDVVLRVDEAAQFAYGNYAAAYGISLVLAVMAIIVLLSMLLIQRKGSRA